MDRKEQPPVRRHKSTTADRIVKQLKNAYYCPELKGRSSTRNATSWLMIGSPRVGP